MSPSTDAILSTARALFLKHGLRRVSVEEICREAGVSKRTFYKHHRDRDALALRILEQLFEESRAALEEILQAELPIDEKVRRIIAAKQARASETSMAFYQDILLVDSEPGRFARRSQEEWTARVRRFYQEAQEQGLIRADIDISLLMAVLVRVRGIIEDPEIQRLEPDLGRLVRSVTSLFFYGILSPNPGSTTTTGA